jgi:hypothetical protein
VSREIDIHHLATRQIYIPPGITLGVLINEDPEQVSAIFKFIGGGSLFIIGVTRGITLGAASLAAAFPNNCYPVNTNEVLALDGPARFYFAAMGTTVTVAVLIGKSSHGNP